MSSIGSPLFEPAINGSKEGWSLQYERPKNYGSHEIVSQMYFTAVHLRQQQRCAEETCYAQQLSKLQGHLSQMEKFHSVDAPCTRQSSHMWSGAFLQLEDAYRAQIEELGRRHENRTRMFQKVQEQQHQPHQDSSGAIVVKQGDREQSISQTLGQACIPQFPQAKFAVSEATLSRVQATSGNVAAGRLDSDSNATSLMIRNIPIQYTQDMLLKEWPNPGDYDFLYLPIHIKKRCNNSFCFINFVNPQAAHAFAKKWHNERLQFYSSRKPLDISLAAIQGRLQNLRHFRCNKTMRLNNKSFQPVVFEGTKRVDIRSLMQALMTKIDHDHHQTLVSPQTMPQGMWISV